LNNLEAADILKPDSGTIKVFGKPYTASRYDAQTSRVIHPASGMIERENSGRTGSAPDITPLLEEKNKCSYETE
jgi:hypothetical protein